MNKKAIDSSLNKWLNTIAANFLRWEKNGLYLDEIDSLESINRKDWIIASFFVFERILKMKNKVKPLIPFLHFPLKYSKKVEVIDVINVDCLFRSLDSYTPPSFHFTDTDYLNSFYKKELQPCQIDLVSQEVFQKRLSLQSYYRTFFDEKERAFSREIYVFSIF